MAVDIPVRILLNTVDNASKGFKNVSQQMSNVGRAMVTIGAAPTAALGLSAKAAIDFESAFAGVRKTVDASEAEFAQLSANIRDIAKETPASTTELSQIGEMAGQLGVSGVDNLTKFIDTIAQMAVTTNLTSESAATSFARIANIMGEPIENVDRMGSVVVDLGNNFATTESEITEFASRIAGAGKIAGLTTDQIFAIGASMSSVGVQAEAGGTAVQKMLIEMNTAVTQGTDSLETFARTAGMTAEEFQMVYEEDAMAAFVHFVEGLGTQGDDAISTLDELGLADQRLIRSFLSLANAGELLNDTYNTSSKAWMENIALTEEAEKRFATMESQLKVLKNRFMDIAITIGNAILPHINKLLEALAPYIEKIANMIAEHPKLTIVLLGIGAAIGALGAALLILAPIITSVTTIVGVLSGAVTLATTVIGGIIAIVGAPLLLAIGAVVAAIAFLALAWKNNWFDIQGKVAAAVEFIKQKWNILKDNIRLLLDSFIYLKDHAIAAFDNMKEKVIGKAKSLYDGVKGWFDKVKGFFDDIIGKAKEAISLNGLLPGRQHGGSVSAAGSYIVGEKGAEIFQPQTAGRIVPHAEAAGMMSGGGGVSVTIENNGVIVDSPGTTRDLAERLYRELSRMARAQNTTVADMFGA